ncbi:unnamed protein product, partial [Ectocarpus sp. 4 AP-2014]
PRSSDVRATAESRHKPCRLPLPLISTRHPDQYGTVSPVCLPLALHSVCVRVWGRSLGDVQNPSPGFPDTTTNSPAPPRRCLLLTMTKQRQKKTQTLPTIATPTSHTCQ